MSRVTSKQDPAYIAYIEHVTKWATRHGITLSQAMSILHQDSAFNPDNPRRDLPTYRSCFWDRSGDFGNLYYSAD